MALLTAAAHTFAIASYPREYALVIAQTLVYVASPGGCANDKAPSVAVDDDRGHACG